MTRAQWRLGSEFTGVASRCILSRTGRNGDTAHQVRQIGTEALVCGGSANRVTV